MQLYFDFSGYSDMAIGLSRIFGIKLPLNFQSPYKATNIIEFWRRWHMTLSRFLRDYLYIPLGGNRKGPARRYLNLFVTMLLGGLWHGAGWTFVIWGALHGIYLAINHAWRGLRKRLGQDLARTTFVGDLTAGTLTFLAVVVGWVLFRASDIDTGWRMLHAMGGGNGVSLPAAFASLPGPASSLLKHTGVIFTLGGGTEFVMTYAWVGGLMFIAFLLPNTQQFMSHFEPALNFVPDRQPPSYRRYLVWSPSLTWSFLIALIATAGVLSLTHPTEFLYFQF
ncbi:MAG: MBOAT family O-acyltransferase [Burkholderiales bacterium]